MTDSKMTEETEKHGDGVREREILVPRKYKRLGEEHSGPVEET